MFRILYTFSPSLPWTSLLSIPINIHQYTSPITKDPVIITFLPSYHGSKKYLKCLQSR